MVTIYIGLALCITNGTAYMRSRVLALFLKTDLTTISSNLPSTWDISYSHSLFRNINNTGCAYSTILAYWVLPPWIGFLHDVEPEARGSKI